MAVGALGSLLLPFATSCENTELTHSFDDDGKAIMTEDSVNVDDEEGISLELESDSLEEQVEEIHFKAKDWEEEAMNADLGSIRK